MLRVTSLGSGSRGNAILVDGSEGSVLVDAGFGTRTLAKRLLAVARHPTDIGALVLTHEHTDHASGAREACAKWQWPLYASAGTLAALRGRAEAPSCSATALPDTAPIVMHGFSVEHVGVPHDARDCRAVILTDLRSGARVGIALDLGHVPAELPTAFARLDLIVVESNHDVAMLDAGPYPHLLKQRIRGGLGHLSNRVTSGLLSECAHRGLRGVLLAHLSETNNTPELAITGSQQALRRAGWSRDRVWAAPQRSVCGPMGLDGALGDVSARQLSLGL